MELTPLEIKKPPRHPDALSESAFAVLSEAASHVTTVAPLLSGGHDSLCATHLASRHASFQGCVHHIDTGIGAKATRAFVEDVCKEYGWTLRVYKSPETYEKFIRERGFPGPGMHQWAYNRLKERCVRMICKTRGKQSNKINLITGCRQQESTRRMGHVERLKFGELSKKTGVVKNKHRVWSAPCFDWSQEEQMIYMDEHDLPKNPMKLRMGMSMECCCGAFAKPNEIEMIRQWCPDVAAEIDRLAAIAKECGKHCVWGTPPPKTPKGVTLTQTGMLCSGCDARAMAAGLVFEETEPTEESEDS